MQILLTGPLGQIGWELTRSLLSIGGVVEAPRSMLDLADPDSIRRCVRDVRPDVIVNAAGYTAVDRAESEPELAMAVNGDGPGILAEEAARAGAALVHFSTDYVFDGHARRAYRPDDEPSPVNVYGRTKLAGERAVLAAGGSPVILRVSWIYGLRRRNFLLTILRRAAVQPELHVVDDQYGSPTWCRLVARATADIVARHLVRDGATSSFGDRSGIHHLSCSGEATWSRFAERIISLAEFAEPPKIVPIGTDDYPTAAVRPRYSVLDCSSTRDAFGVVLPAWDAALEQLFEEDVRAAVGREEAP